MTCRDTAHAKEHASGRVAPAVPDALFQGLGQAEAKADPWERVHVPPSI